MISSKLFRSILLVFFLIIVSCQTTPPVREPERAVSLPASPPPSPKGSPKIALVLGGGAARGFAHVGVLRVLEREKIPIDMIVGTSVGALVGAIYASEKDVFQLEWLAFQIQPEDLFDFSLFSFKRGPVQGKKLENFIKTRLRVKNVEDLSPPVYPVATNLMTGETVVIETGVLATAVRASTAIPGVFVPAELDGRILVDGG